MSWLKSVENLVVGSAVNVFCVDMKDFLTIVDAKFCLSDLLIYPGKYRVVHWEDKQKSFPLKYFYNKITKGTKVEKKFGDPVSLKMEDSPMHVITSNSPLSDDDPFAPSLNPAFASACRPAHRRRAPFGLYINI